MGETYKKTVADAQQFITTRVLEEEMLDAYQFESIFVIAILLLLHYKNKWNYALV